MNASAAGQENTAQKLGVPGHEGQEPGAGEARGAEALLQSGKDLGEVIQQALVLQRTDAGAA